MADATGPARARGASDDRGGGEPGARPAHLLFVHAADEMYGSDLILLTIVRGLARDRHTAHVVLPTDVQGSGLLSAELKRSGVAVTRTGLAVLRRKYLAPAGVLLFAGRLASSVLALARIARRERVDVIHTHTAAVLPAAIVARLTGTPHVWHVSEIVTRPRAMRRFLAWAIARGADRVVAVSHAVRDHLVASEPAIAPRCVVVHNGIDASRFGTPAAEADGARLRAELGVGGRPLVGMVGRVGTWKGQELLIEAAARVVRSRPDVTFLLVGGVYDGQVQHFDRLRALAAAAGVGDRVVVTDFRRDVPAVLAALDVFVQPSLEPDPFPTTVLEAMASGRPVVATAHGGPVEMVADGETGYLVPPGDAAAMAARIVALVDDAPLRAAMGARARRRVDEEFSLPAFSRAYAELYDAVRLRATRRVPGGSR